MDLSGVDLVKSRSLCVARGEVGAVTEILTSDLSFFEGLSSSDDQLLLLLPLPVL